MYVFSKVFSSYNDTDLGVQIIQFDTTLGNIILSNDVLTWGEIKTKSILGYNLTGGSGYTAYSLLSDATFVQSAITTYQWFATSKGDANRYYVVKDTIGETGSGTNSFTKTVFMKDEYVIAENQFTAVAESVYNGSFYGKNGVESGTLQNKENLTKDEVKHRVDIWSNYNSGIVCPSDSSNMFWGCTNLTTIPLLDTSNVTSMEYMFYNCENLTTIPLLNTSNVTNMSQMFGGFNGCTSLTDESLNNILAMCKNATSYTDTKTLRYIGLTSTQANKCKTLSNYSAFTSAGWTTGY